MIGPLPAPPPFPASNHDQRHTGRLKMRDNLLTVGGGGEGRGKEPNHTTAGKTAIL